MRTIIPVFFCACFAAMAGFRIAGKVEPLTKAVPGRAAPGMAGRSAGSEAFPGKSFSGETFLRGSSPGASFAGDSFPQAELSNGIIHARFYLPDTAKGYYRGSRFDWSGVMPSLEYKGHSFSGQWFDHYTPTLHDAIMGPVESFDPIGYGRAASGGSFVAIGIGALAKGGLTGSAEPAYSPFHYYSLVNAGAWEVRRGSDRLEFRQTLRDTACSYVYDKHIRLIKGEARLVIRHRLKNTGRQTIETNVYDHNLMPLDGQPVGPGLVFSFPFGLTATGKRRMGTIADIRDRQIVFLEKPVKGEDVYAVLGGYGEGAGDYDIKMENHHTGAGVRIRCDRPLSKLVFWSSSTVACPEPYIHIKVDPGSVFTWTISYTFYEFPKDNKADQKSGQR